MEPTRVLFVCVENACRSQMAEAFARHYGRERIEAFSAGSKPRDQVDPKAIAVLEEQGLTTQGQRSKSLAELPKTTWDVVVSMGCGEDCAVVPAKKRLDWQIPDPAHQPLEVYRHVRDLIEEQVKRLIEQLTGSTP